MAALTAAAISLAASTRLGGFVVDWFVSRPVSFIVVVAKHAKPLSLTVGIALHVDQRLLGGIDRDPVEPGVELRLAAKLVQGPVGADEGFLGDVFDQVDVPHHAADQPLDAPLVLDDQQFEGLAGRPPPCAAPAAGRPRRAWTGGSRAARGHGGAAAAHGRRRRVAVAGSPREQARAAVRRQRLRRGAARSSQTQRVRPCAAASRTSSRRCRSRCTTDAVDSCCAVVARQRPVLPVPAQFACGLLAQPESQRSRGQPDRRQHDPLAPAAESNVAIDLIAPCAAPRSPRRPRHPQESSCETRTPHRIAHRWGAHAWKRCAQTRLNTSVPLVPPKPKLFFTATSIFRSRASLAQ